MRRRQMLALAATVPFWRSARADEPAVPADLPTPRRMVPADPWSLRTVLSGASSYGPLQPGDHVVLADGVYAGPPIRFTTSGTESDPIVLRAATKLAASFKVPMGIRADHVWLWGLDLTDGQNAYAASMGILLRGKVTVEPCQLAFDGTDCRFMRGRISWTKLKDKTRGTAPNRLQAIQVASTSSGFRFLRNEVQFRGVPLKSEIPSNLTGSGAYLVRPVVLHMRAGGDSNNRDAEVAWNLFKGWPGGDWWDGVKKSRGWGNRIGYDKLIRGTVFSIGADYNDSVNARTSGIDLHHNVIVGNGADMDFGGIRADGQNLCSLRFNTNLSGDGMRLRVAQNWLIVGNTIRSPARGLYGVYGRGHQYIGNYSEVPLAVRSGNCTNESINPFPATKKAWVATGYPDAQGWPRPTCAGNRFIGNRGPLFVGWDQWGDSHAALVSGTEIYGHMAASGEPRTAFDGVDLVDMGYTVGDTLISDTIPEGVTVPEAVELAESDVGPDSDAKMPAS